MNLAIFHYHLSGGGVTRVIANQLLALDAALDEEPDANPARWRVAVLFGGRCRGWPKDLAGSLAHLDVSLEPVERLDYDQVHGRGGPDVDGLLGDVDEVFRRLGFEAADTLLHIHNHSLGKNVSLGGMIVRLAERGHAMLLQPHDFSEDFRPRNFDLLHVAAGGRNAPRDWTGWIYPQAPQIHYATLNHRDHTILQAAGIPAERLARLANPVTPQEKPADRAASRAKLAQRCDVPVDVPFVLYPVRGIGRKNLGEALLWSMLLSRDAVVAVTLAPANPREKPTYRRWEALAEELNLPFRFAVGGPGKLKFRENMVAADWILTTAVAEGFGMVYLEAWLAGHGLLGRDLPDITSDFTDAGLQLDDLEQTLEIPADAIGGDRIRRAFVASYARAMAPYGRRPERSSCEKLDGEWVDFADLTVPLQEEFLRAVHADPSLRDRVIHRNPRIDQAISRGAEESTERIEANRQVVQETFSLLPSGRRLLNRYLDVASSRRAQPEPLSAASEILEAFLAMERYRPVRG